ncbi:predicted protein [Naegleria gruberi]|uniref:Predicted protein n=1 Tax=Naegleria gruberi TaxID=5762 RepID=D2VL13_NAEGR|nr:uncharacterized protein NAEGRDRAFT_69625 [Naegleria gruberi]EFC42458.1 predicted protein [Naegleria gruberi]|eukprot:XP_002675202.1 predicted protein [Naegleria gruberi strain NEG-M]
MDHSQVNVELAHQRNQQAYVVANSQAKIANLDNNEFLNQGLIKNEYFADGNTIFILIMKILLNICTLGLFSPIVVNMITRRSVRSMVIGNRRLQYDDGGDLTMAMWCYLDKFLNIITLGWWYLLGFSHKYYLSKFDEKITWGPPAKTIKTNYFNDSIVWEPVDDGRGSFKIFSAYLGVWNEFAGFMLGVLNFFFLGTLSPISVKFYFSKLLSKVRLGVGKFAVIHPHMIESIDNHNRDEFSPIQVPRDQIYNTPYPVSYFPQMEGHGMYELKLRFVADVCDMYGFYCGYNCLMYITCGCFKLCSSEYLRRFLNKKVGVHVEPISITVQP